MVISAGDKILIRELRLSLKWGVKKIKRKFPNNNFKSSALKDLI